MVVKPRTISDTLVKTATTFPSLVLTGPRQSGKTTLLKQLFGATHVYLSLENPNVRQRARQDPVGFLSQYHKPIILDEIQYVPELLPYIKTAIDEDRSPGKWLLTGSQNFTLMGNVSQSLAGRTAVLSLLPFSLAESTNHGKQSLSPSDFFSNVTSLTTTNNKHDIAQTILRGSYPEINTNPSLDRQLWCGSYVNTYLERDIRNLKQVGDLNQYEIFLRACAVRTGQILDLSSIASEIGVSFTTAKRWLSLLQTGYQIILVYPYYRNLGKRLVKRPKLYFTDTGLASYLLGIHSVETLISGPFFGPLFETLVVTDFWKRFLHHAQSPSIYYLRTVDKLEVDMLIEIDSTLNLIEIKSTATIRPEHVLSLSRAKSDLSKYLGSAAVISNSADSFTLHNGIFHIPAQLLSIY